MRQTSSSDGDSDSWSCDHDGVRSERYALATVTEYLKEDLPAKRRGGDVPRVCGDLPPSAVCSLKPSVPMNDLV